MSTARFDTLSNSAGTSTVPVNTVVSGSAKAWVNFDGTTSPGTIRASFNVSSVTKNGTGNYTVNFTTAMPDADYSVGGLPRVGVTSDPIIWPEAFSSTSLQFRTGSSSVGSYHDYDRVTVQIFR
jgi:hypothetical protein